MYDQLKQRIAQLLVEPRPLRPQTQRQLPEYLEDHHADLGTFLLCAAEVLEEDTLEILFAPQFTPTLDDRACVADLMGQWQPSKEQIRELITDLDRQVAHGVVILPDGTHAKLTMHQVMVERYIKLLRLDSAPSAQVAASLRESLNDDLWPIAAALTRQRGFNDPAFPI